MRRRGPDISWSEAKYGMHLSCPYHPEFLERMKEIVPEDERKWDKGNKAWWISDAYLDEVDALIFEVFEVQATGRVY